MRTVVSNKKQNLPFLLIIHGLGLVIGIIPYITVWNIWYEKKGKKEPLTCQQ